MVAELVKEPARVQLATDLRMLTTGPPPRPNVEKDRRRPARVGSREAACHLLSFRCIQWSCLANAGGGEKCRCQSCMVCS